MGCIKPIMQLVSMTQHKLRCERNLPQKSLHHYRTDAKKFPSFFWIE